MRPSVRTFAVVVLGLLAASAIFAPHLAPYDPLVASGPPAQSPGPGHLFGTNDIGQDVWSQWLWGGRASLLVAGVVALLSTCLSWTIGILTGTWRRGEGALMAVTDLLLALPALPLFLLVVALLGPSQVHLMLALGLLSWPAFARVVRAQVITVNTAPYVEAARALGGTPLHLARHHVFPATLELLPAKLVLTVRFALFAEATLSFLGLGDPSARSWGTMLGWAFSDPLAFANGSWTWWVLPPALAIVAAVLGTTWLATSFEATPPQARTSHAPERPASGPRSGGEAHCGMTRGQEVTDPSQAQDDRYTRSRDYVLLHRL